MTLYIYAPVVECKPKGLDSIIHILQYAFVVSESELKQTTEDTEVAKIENLSSSVTSNYLHKLWLH